MDVDARIRKRLAELEQLRQQIAAQVELGIKQLAACDGAIAELNRLLVAPAPDHQEADDEQPGPGTETS